MMNGWGGNRRECNFREESHGMPQRSNTRKPPSGPWQPTVPSWEKRFCTSVCLMPWRKICETKEVMDMYDNIVKWDDSAGEEAFRNAKFRFWAHINGLHCDVPLPDPDIYIDNIDWNPYIDPELVVDLDRQPDIAAHDGELTSFDFDHSCQPVRCTGWGENNFTAVQRDETSSRGCKNHKIDVGDCHVGVDQDVTEVPQNNPWEGNDRGTFAENSKYGDDSWDNCARGYEAPPNKNNSWNDSWGQWKDRCGNPDDVDARHNSSAEANPWECGKEDCNNAVQDGRNAWESGNEVRYRGPDQGVAWEKKNLNYWKSHACSGAPAIGQDWRTRAGSYEKRGEGRYRHMPRHHQNSFIQINSSGWSGGGKKRSNFVDEKLMCNARSQAPWLWNSKRPCRPVYHD